MLVMITGDMGYVGTNLKRILNFNNISVIGIDEKEGNKVEDLKDLKGCDAVVHLAAISGLANCENNKEEAIRCNVSAAFHIINLAYKENKKLIFMSSQAAKTPIGLYALTKYMAERESIRLNKKGSNIIVLRATNIYGGNDYFDNKTTVVSKFYKAFENKEKLVITGDGSQIRDFIHVSDICNYIYKALISKKNIINPIDAGTGVGTSIKELANYFNTDIVFDSNSNMVGVSKNVANTNNIKSYLDCDYKVSIKEYIKKLCLQVK